jgi:hypothetical protein
MQYPLTSLLARLSTGTRRGFLVASFHTALVPSLTLPLSPVEEKTTSSLPHLLMKEQQERVFERQMQNEKKAEDAALPACSSPVR